MSAATRLVLFGALLAVLFSAAAAAGGALDPDARDEERRRADGRRRPRRRRGGRRRARKRRRRCTASRSPTPGSSSSVLTPELPPRPSAGARLPRRSTTRGEPVRDYDVEHERRMHLIVVRRDLTGFQHLHPELRADGTWVAPITLRRRRAPTASSPTSRTTATATTLGRRPARRRRRRPARRSPRPRRPPPAGDGYAVELDAGAVRPASEAELRFTVTRDGEPVATEPYLGAGGHLVALREGDLAFLHVHPRRDGARRSWPRSRAAGRYRLFLQFQHDGRGPHGGRSRRRWHDERPCATTSSCRSRA